MKILSCAYWSVAYLFLSPCYIACGSWTLAAWAMAVKGLCPNCWTTREFLICISLGKCLFKSLAHFSIWFFFFFCLFIVEFYNSLCNMCADPISDTWFATIIYSVGCVFTFLVMSFVRIKVFNFVEINFFIYLCFWYDES